MIGSWYFPLKNIISLYVPFEQLISILNMIISFYCPFNNDYFGVYFLLDMINVFDFYFLLRMMNSFSFLFKQVFINIF